VKLANTKFNKNSFSGSGVVTCGQMDMTKLKAFSCERAYKCNVIGDKKPADLNVAEAV
jgi:hypothetical protein